MLLPGLNMVPKDGSQDFDVEGCIFYFGCYCVDAWFVKGWIQIGTRRLLGAGAERLEMHFIGSCVGSGWKCVDIFLDAVWVCFVSGWMLESGGWRMGVGEWGRRMPPRLDAAICGIDWSCLWQQTGRPMAAGWI